MELTPSPSSFLKQKIKYNDKKPTKNRIIWINFSKNTQGTLHAHFAIAQFGLPSIVFALRSPIFCYVLLLKISHSLHRYRKCKKTSP